MKNREIKLHAVAEAQQGYFTTKQAVAAGYVAPTHHYHVGTGAWVRERRGIYRLAMFPASPEGQYVLWSLWSCTRGERPQGVFSHQTSLGIHDLSDLMPAKLHMTVPESFRRSVAIPKVLCLHRAGLAAGEVVQRQGFRVVLPLRAVVDLLKEGAESPDHLRQALKQGLARGLIGRSEIRRHPDRKMIERLLKGVGR